MRYMGYEVEDISSILGVPVGTVRNHLNAAVAASADKERINIVREAEITKLEELEEAFSPAALGQAFDPDGNPVPPQASAAKVVLDVMDRRAKLMGIDKALPQASVTNMTLIQILSQIPVQPPVGHNSEAVNTQPTSPLFSREATDA